MTSRRPRGYITQWRPQAATRALLDQVQTILVEYEAYLPLSLRQVFYRLVGAFLYPKTLNAYKTLSDHLSSARRAGIIPFSALRDDGPTREDPYGYGSLAEAQRVIGSICETFSLHRQIGQPVRTLLLTEAGGMVPQLASVAHPFGVSVLSAGGFDSTTAVYDLAQEILRESTRPTRVLHVGDHDPSGVHVYSHLDEDVTAFVLADGGHRPLFERVAVLPEHVAAYSLPTAPANPKDKRRFSGIGGDPNATVQAEALAPDILAGLVRAALLAGWDAEAEAELIEREERDRAALMRWYRKLEGGEGGGGRKGRKGS